MSAIARKVVFWGVLIPSALVIFDLYIGPSKYFKETPLGIYQPALPAISQDQKVLDPATGKLQLSGYTSEPGVAERLYVNYEDSRAVSSSSPSLNKLKFRNWNYYILNTPKHMIQFNFVDAVSNGERGVCPSSIVIFDKTNPRDTMRKAEESTFTCAKHDRHRLFDFKHGVTLEDGNGGKMVMSVTPVEGEKRLYRV